MNNAVELGPRSNEIKFSTKHIGSFIDRVLGDRFVINTDLPAPSLVNTCLQILCPKVNLRFLMSTEKLNMDHSASVKLKCPVKISTLIFF